MFKITYMKNKLFIKTLLKIFILTLVAALSFLNFKELVDQSLSDNGSLTFISHPPEEDYLFKKFAYISGGVKKPGVYEMNDEDLRLIELIELAGGLNEKADKDKLNKDINLSQVIEDGDHIFIPIISDTSSKKTPDNSLINLNTATQSQLDSLPGVGPSTAKKIIDARPFTSISDLKNVSGIGESKYNELKNLVSIN